MEDLGLSLGNLDARFTDAFAAADYLESIRWPDGFRYDTRHLSDAQRTVRALAQSPGKRLMYADSR